MENHLNNVESRLNSNQKKELDMLEFFKKLESFQTREELKIKHDSPHEVLLYQSYELMKKWIREHVSTSEDYDKLVKITADYFGL